jgi:hypothetical protein
MNNLIDIRTMAAGLFVWTAGLAAAWAQTLPPAPLPPVSLQTFKRQPAQPDMKQPLTSPRLAAQPVILAPGPSPWRPLSRQAPLHAGAMLLLTDGTVMVHDQGAKNSGSSNWWRLTPDINGSYLNGTWTKLARCPQVTRRCTSPVPSLPTGGLLLKEANTTTAKRCSPFSARYTIRSATRDSGAAPLGEESMIGAAASTVLADGTFMIGGVFTTEQALLNPVSRTWFIVGKDKGDTNSEETWTLLPNWQVLTVDTILKI